MIFMKTLIINSPLYENPENKYEEVLPPIWLWYICSNLKENWFSVELLDAVAWKIPLDEIIDYIEHWNFSHVWLNIFSTNCQLVKRIVTSVSREVSFILWGAFTKSNANDIINWETKNNLNIVIWEGDFIVKDIVSWNLNEQPIVQDWNKRVFKVDKESSYYPSNISSIKLDRTLFEHEPTINAYNWKKECNIVTSRWCIYDCTFCSAAVSLNKWVKARIRDKESIKEELLSIKEELLSIKKLHPDVKSVRILDDLFLRNDQSAIDACNIFSELNLEWRAMAHIKSFKDIDVNILKKMKMSGCSELSIWIESWNNALLKKIHKNNTVDDVENTIERILEAWIWVKWYFIIWFPEETENQFKDTYNLAKSLKEMSLKYWSNFRISVFQFRPYHWTQLYYDIIEKWKTIPDIKPNQNFWDQTIWEFDFWGWNFSSEKESVLQKYIKNIRKLNVSSNYVPYNESLDKIPTSWIFFVWLSHKLGKDGSVLDAFCESTNSWKIIGDVLQGASWFPIYKTNLVKWVPLDDKNKIRYPSLDEKKIWLDMLIKEIDRHSPKIVFLFWKQVSDFVIKEMWLKKNNEYEYMYGNTKFLLADHPSYIAVYKRNSANDYVFDIIEKIKKSFPQEQSL